MATSTKGTPEGRDAAEVQQTARGKIEAVFKAGQLTSEVFVVVGGDRAWGATSTYAPRLALANR